MADDKKTERKNLTIIEVEEIKKVGDKQIPKLSFLASDGETDHRYFTFRPTLFEAIKVGQIINADIETEQKGEYTNRKVVQIYLDGQAIGGKKDGYQGKSPEELDQTARTMSLSYAKDLAVADKIKVVEIINQADVFYNWVKKNGTPKVPEVKGKEPTPSQVKSPAPPEDKLETELFGPPEAKTLPPSESKVDMDWLKESLEKLNWTDVSKWLRKKYPKATGVDVRGLVASLTKEQQKEFGTEVKNRLEASGIN